MISEDRKVFVLGIDGATFDLIVPWCRQGLLPNMAKLLEESSAGILDSTPESNSAQAWSSFMTGLNPGKHGLYYFVRRKEHSYNFEFTNAMARDGRTLWRIVGDSGKKSIVINVPITYPPERVNGILISGMDAPGMRSGFTHPGNLYNELVEKTGGYIIEADAAKHFRNGEYHKALRSLEETIDKRYSAASYLMHRYPWELFVLVLTETDRVQHLFWRFMDESHPLYRKDEDEELRNGILRIYQKVDQVLAQVRKDIGEDTTLIVMSDHGAGPSSNRTVYINNWLNQKGLLHYKSKNLSNPMKRLYFECMSASMWRLHVTLKRVVPRGIKDFFRRYSPGLSNRIRTFGQSLSIDWSRTVAFSTETTPSIRLNVKGEYPLGIVEPGDEYERVRNSVIEHLRGLRDPENQAEVVGEIFTREQIYHGKHVREAPDITFRWKDGAYTHRFSQSAPAHEAIRVLSAKELFYAESVSRPSGVHKPEGIVIIAGRHIRKGNKLGKAQIIDVAPTVLYAMGLPVPSNMDGRILLDAFEQAHVVTCVPQYVDGQGAENLEDGFSYSNQEEMAIAERLRGLGYIE